MHTLSGLFFAALLSAALLAQTGWAGQSLSPEAALLRLQEGNERFARNALISQPLAAQRTHTAEHGQQPFACVLTCSDSRLAPEMLFNQGLGDVFVVRVAGNVLSAAVAGSLEYGAEHLGAPLLVVLGHSRCGAVAAVTAGSTLHGNMPALVAPLIPVVQFVRQRLPQADQATLAAEAEKENVRQVTADIFASSPLIRTLVLEGKLRVVGAVYDIASGTVQWLDAPPQAAARR